MVPPWPDDFRTFHPPPSDNQKRAKGKNASFGKPNKRSLHMAQQTAFISFLILSATLAIVLLGTRLNKIESKISMLSRVDAKLDLLLKQSGLEYDPYKNLPPSVVDAVQRGKKIEAIKRYRETTGVGLKEAKEFIEDVQRRGGVS
jgi:hypothetical protein